MSTQILKRKEDLDDRHKRELIVFGAPLCGRCKEVKSTLRGAGFTVREETFVPNDLEGGALVGRVGRAEASLVLAALTWQDGLLPIIVTPDYTAVLFQDDVEDFVR